MKAGPPTGGGGGGGGGQLGQFALGPLYEGGPTAKNGFEISGPAAILSIVYTLRCIIPSRNLLAYSLASL